MNERRVVESIAALVQELDVASVVDVGGWKAFTEAARETVASPAAGAHAEELLLAVRSGKRSSPE